MGDKECLPNDIISVGGFEGTSVTVPCPEHTTGTNEVYICKNGQWIAQGICTYPAPTNFSYALSDFVLEVGQRMTAITPTVVCYNCEFVLKDRLLGTVLPTGIFLDYVTGTLLALQLRCRRDKLTLSSLVLLVETQSVRLLLQY